ncbi:DUF5011 domain-containing protein, partial [bacterium]|nr:DUF5011 domain-containing protein [bacterium]
GAKGYYPSTASTAWRGITAYNDLTLVHPDIESPVITLIGVNPLEVYKGATFSDPGATVTDNKDAIRTINGSGTVNTAAVGIYTLTYTATDAAGNLALPVTRTVNVVLNPLGDEDGDGLTNGAEMLGGTSPYEKDSDNDGVNDTLEIVDGTNPTNPDSFNNLNRGLVAYYPFNGNANDESGNGNHGSSVSTIADSDRRGENNRAKRFSSASRSRVEIPWQSSQVVGITCFSFWFKTAGTVDQARFVISGSAEYDFSFHLTSALRVDGLRFIPSPYVVVDSTEPYESGRWNHVVAVSGVNTAEQGIWLNGRKIQSLNTLGNPALESQHVSNRLWIGGRQSDPGAANLYFDGWIDDVRIYNRALSSVEIGQLFSAEAPNTPPTLANLAVQGTEDSPLRFLSPRTNYNFDDGTLQGWHNRIWDGTGWTDLPANIFTDSRISGVDGLFIPAGGRVSVSGNTDTHNNVLWLRSPEFLLTGAGDLTVDLYRGGAVSAAPTNQSEIPASATGMNNWDGWRGVALCRVRDGAYVLVKPRTQWGSDAQTVTFTQEELAPYVNGDLYTLDLLNTGKGGWGWIEMDSVSIPGSSLSALSSLYTDPENDPLVSVTIQTLPLRGTLTLAGAPVTANQVISGLDLGFLTYTPNANVYGDDSFQVTASDGTNSSAPSTITVAVAQVNDAPILAGQATTYDALAEFIAGPTPQSVNSRWQYLGGNVSALTLLGNWKTTGNEIIQNQSQWDGNSGY